MKRLVVPFVLCVLLSACSFKTISPDASGEKIFQTICARCHGSDLQGGIGPALGVGSEAADMSDEFFRFTIENGLGRMPSFKGTLSNEQAERVITYIRDRQQG